MDRTSFLRSAQLDRICALHSALIPAVILTFACVTNPDALARAATYDLKSDWSDLSNPNGAWSYNNSNGPIAVHQSSWGNTDPTWVFGQAAWALTPTGPGHIVTWMKDEATQSSPPYDLVAGDVNTHTWDGQNGASGTGNLSAVTWTAPSDGIYDFTGNFWQGVHIGRSADAFVFVGCAAFTYVSLFDGDGFSRAAPFSFGATGIPLAANDTIELRFVTTSFAGTHVGVNLTITAVPEPTSLALTGMAAVALLRANRARRQVRN